jgi:hypothetical protein
MWLDLLFGLAWGMLVGLLKGSWLQWVVARNAGKPPQQVGQAVLRTQLFCYLLNAAALIVVYRHLWVLIGAAIGLTVMLKRSIIEYLVGSRQHRKE